MVNYKVAQIFSRDEKWEILHQCDKAFEKSVVKNPNFPQLFEKIDAYAEFLAAKATDVMGYLAMYANNTQTKQAYITLLGVHPDYQRMGVGEALLKACIALALERSMETLCLEVYCDNPKAISFYEKNGFVKQTETDHNSMYMVKQLKGE